MQDSKSGWWAEPKPLTTSLSHLLGMTVQWKAQEIPEKVSRKEDIAHQGEDSEYGSNWVSSGHFTKI